MGLGREQQVVVAASSRWLVERSGRRRHDDRSLKVAVSIADQTGLPSPSRIIDEHLAHLRWRNLSAGTITQRARVLDRLRRFGVDPLAANSEDLAAFRDRRTVLGRPLAIETQANELAHLRSWYRWLVLEGVRADDPTIRVPRPKLPRRMPRPMAESDLARAIDTAPDRIRPMYLLAAYAGLRACEIAPLRGEDLWWHLAAPLIFLRRQKGGDEGAVPISPVIAEDLRALPRKGYLFPYHDGRLGHIPAHRVSQLANAHLHSIGIWHTLHTMRHRFGTQVYRLSGCDIRQTQELMRHKSIVSTVGYTLIDQHAGAAVLAGLPAIA